jgi:phosphoribosyl-ATP pyrophosphohydrolase
MSAFTLADLADIVAQRAANADPASSYTAKLIADGVERCARKFGEEAVEAVIAALGQDDRALTGEAADVLYHLLVLLRARGISLDAVMGELETRTRQSGLQEKAARGKT